MSKITTVDWLPIITECRTSGLSDRQWCTENNVAYSTFYYHVRRLRKEACELPVSARKCTIPMQQEVVQLDFDTLRNSHCELNHQEAFLAPAITLQINNVQICISNSANAAVIANTIQALQHLC